MFNKLNTKNCLSHSLLACLGYLVMPSVVFASSSHEHHASVTDLVFPVLNFAMYVGLMYRLLNKPISAAVQARSRAVSDGLEKAQNSFKKAQEVLLIAEKRKAGIDLELKNIKSAIDNEARGESDRVVSDANEKAQRIAAQAQSYADAEVRAQQMLLKRELADQVLSKAGQKLSSRINTDANIDQLIRQGVFKNIVGLN